MVLRTTIKPAYSRLHNLDVFPLRVTVALCARYEWATVARGRGFDERRG